MVTPASTIENVISFYMEWWRLILLLLIVLSIIGAFVLWLLFKESKEENDSQSHSRSRSSGKGQKHAGSKSKNDSGRSITKSGTKRVGQGKDDEQSCDQIEGIEGNEDDEQLEGLPSNEPEEEEQSEVKYIGYDPVNIFAQTEPLHYPYVVMPKPGCVIKFPRKGRTGRKGYTEKAFKEYLTYFLKDRFRILDDRFVLVKNKSLPFEPDFALVNEKDGVNLFLDIEIDEPYEGINDIQNRQPTHYQKSDTDRNNAFKNRGWIVIRFAEIQVHQHPESCCRFIADVIQSVVPKIGIAEDLEKIAKVVPVPQWTKEQAKQWSLEKYREAYLDISKFGIEQEAKMLEAVEETQLGEAIEKEVSDDPTEEGFPSGSFLTLKELSNKAISEEKYLQFKFDNDRQTIIRPIEITDNQLTGFCYVKNQQRTFDLISLQDVHLKDQYFTKRLTGPRLGINNVARLIHIAIRYQKYIRLRYTRTTWTELYIDPETMQAGVSHVNAEESIRTISNVLLSKDALSKDEVDYYGFNENYITAYCHKREAQRTFKFSRISELEILDL